jgi:hypothetical protein
MCFWEQKKEAKKLKVAVAKVNEAENVAAGSGAELAAAAVKEAAQSNVEKARDNLLSSDKVLAVKVKRQMFL